MKTIYTRFILTALLVLLISACSAATQAPHPTIAPTFTQWSATSTPEPENTPTIPPTPAPSLPLTPINTLTRTIISVPLTPTPTPVILADTFFTGCAFLDKNTNKLVDSEDVPIGGIRFTVTLSGGAGFGYLTSDKDGCAIVIIPGALPRESWPIVAQIEIPQTFAYIPIGDTTITLVYPNARAEFLFSQP